MRDGRIALRDYRLADRITFYNPDGTFSHTWSVWGGLRWTFAGRWRIKVDTGGVVWLPFIGDVPRSGGSPRTTFLRVREDGVVLDTVLTPPRPEVEVDRVRITVRGRTRRIKMPYQPSALVGWSPFGHFATGRSDQYRIEVLPPPPVSRASGGTPEGSTPSPASIITRDVPRVPVSREERRAARDRIAERVQAAGGSKSGRIPGVVRSKPYIGTLTFSEDGRMLVRASMPSRLVNGEWVEPWAFDVFDIGGRFMGRVVFPDSFQMLRMEGDTLWGVFRGENDVESIRRYRVLWPQP
jgi:hypothetical protein